MVARFDRAKRRPATARSGSRGGARALFSAVALVVCVGLFGFAPAAVGSGVGSAVDSGVGSGMASGVGATAPSTWPMPRYDAAQDGFNQAEHALGRGAVAGLHLEGTATMSTPLSDYSASPPVLSAHELFVAGYGLDQTSVVYAFPSTCGTTTSGCAPLWTADVGDDSEPQVAVADGIVLVAGDDGGTPYPFAELYAYPARCRSDGGRCSPMWTAHLPGYEPFTLAPTVSRGVVYIAGVNDLQANRNYLFAFPLQCGRAGASCQPLWRGQMELGDVYKSAAVADGLVFVPDYTGWVYGFETSCGEEPTTTRSPICQPVWSGNTGELGPSAAAVGDGELVVGSQNGSVYAFPVHCALSCLPRWVGRTAGNVRSDAAIADGVVYITSDDGKLYAFPTTCHGRCHALWTATLLASGIDSFYGSPAVADGVVYVAWADNSPVGIAAFRAARHCPAGCPPLWTGTAGNYELRGTTVAGGELWVSGGPTGGPGTVYAFGVG